MRESGPTLPTSCRSAPTALERLRRRRDFLRVAASGRKAATGTLVLQAAPRVVDDGAAGLGFTCSRKVGNAVARNRARRRLREAARKLLPRAGRAGTDYVLIGRKAALDCPFDALERDLERALDRLLRDATPASGRRPR